MKIFVNSLPKSGTNLLEKLMGLIDIKYSGRSVASSNILGRYSLTKSILHQDHFSGISVPIGLEYPVSVSVKWLNRICDILPGQYLSGHAAYSEQLDYLLASKDIKVLQIYRDPRAVLVSWAKFVIEERNQWYPCHKYFRSMSLQERILFLLRGGYVEDIDLYYSSLREILTRSAGWLGSNNTLIVRFEDLVGPQGGGSDEFQSHSISRVLEFIGKTPTKEVIGTLQSSLYGGTQTFRQGSVDGWKESINTKLEDLIYTSLHDLPSMNQLGYFR